MANRWSVCGKSVVWRRCLLGLAVERERQRIGKGRPDGLGVGKPRNRWSEEVCGKSVVWRRCLLGLAVERERQRIGKGRLDGLGIELPWVWLACRGCYWGGADGRVFVKGKAGRKVMAEYSWKGKHGKKRQSRVGNGFMTFLFLVLVLLFYYFFFNAVLMWKIVEAWKASVLYIYID